MGATKFSWLTLRLPVMGRGWVKWLGILWMNSQILAAIWPYEHRREPFLCKGQNTTTRSSEASLRPHSASSQRPTAIWVLNSTWVSPVRPWDPPETMNTQDWSLLFDPQKQQIPQPQDREDRFGWSLIPGNNYALEGGNIHCCALFLSSWEPRLSRQLWIS